MYESFAQDDVAEDYRLLLRRGSVMRRLAAAQHASWRKAMRRAAAVDRHRIRTWSRSGRPAEVWAVLPDWSLTADERQRLQRRLSWLGED